MKYLFYTGVFTVIIIFALAMSNQATQRIDLIPKPTFDSVVIQDWRSVCEKKSELTLIEQWEKKCENTGQDRNCSLPKKDVSQMFQYKTWYVESCNPR